MTQEDEIGYQDRSPDELQSLVGTWERAPFSGSYVAPPAPGYDTEGLWHCFNTGSRSGYSTHAVALQWALDELGITTQLVPHRNLDIDIEKFPKDRYDRLFAWHKAAVGHPHALFVSFPPDIVAQLGEMGPPLIPYCAFEGVAVSRFCAQLCKGPPPPFAAIWVVSEFVRQAFIRAGVDGDHVLTVPPILYGGPWDKAWFEAWSAQPRPVSEADPFVFGAMGTWHSRKGFPQLIRAYWTAFRREDPVVLSLRTSAFGEDGNLTIKAFNEKLTADVAEIAKEFGDNDFPASKRLARIRVVTGTGDTDEEVVRHLVCLDAYANATYGEGLGIPHIWAKAGGVPLVSSTYGAVGDLLMEISSGANHLVNHRLENVDREMIKLNLMFDRDTQWGVYDTESFADAMRACFEQGRVRDVKGASLVRERFGVESVLPSVSTALTRTLGDEVIGKIRNASR